VKATIWYKEGRVEVDAHPTPVPGLIINENPGAPGVWVVTHAPSGAAVLKLPDPEAALHAACRLGPLTDWTLPGRVLRQFPALDQAVQALARELDCWTLTFAVGAGAVSDARLAETEAS
jgi:hypothetical protein